MNLMTRPALVALALTLPTLLPPLAGAATFTNSNKVNVLRQYNLLTGTNVVTASISSTAPTSVTSGPFSNDGSGRVDQWFDAPGGGDGTGTTEFTLPGPRTVGSFSANFNSSHDPQGGFLLEGFNGSWFPLFSTPTVSGTLNGTFAPATVTKLRYTVTGPGEGPSHIQNQELQVFLTNGQTVDYASRVNYLRDAVNTLLTTDSANKPGVWTIRSSAGGGNATVDGDYFNGHVHAGSTTTTTRAFFTLTMTNLTQMEYGHLGWFGGQQWNNYEVYTSAAAVMPATKRLLASDPATIQAAGWILQLDSGGFQPAQFFDFLQGGFYRHILVVWDGPGALVEFELFLPEPSSVALLAAGAVLMLRRRRA